MSRRGKEFNHRTAIFEGAFRAWSHLGGLSPELIETRTAGELDPTTLVIENDERLNENSSNSNGTSFSFGSPTINAEGSRRREFAYETLPRSGLLHPFVRAILSAWLGKTGVDKEALEIGLTTLRCWWQHRRKGENKTAIKMLGGTDNRRDTLDRYTRQFFELAHCLVVVEQAEAPRTLKKKLSDRQKRLQGSSPTMGVSHSSASSLSSSGPSFSSTLNVNMKGRCVPGILSVSEIADEVNRKATMMAFHGNMRIPSIHEDDDKFDVQDEFDGIAPMVYISGNGELQILLHVNGITCAHCILILETVLKGCSKDGKSPIVGLLDAVADRGLNCVLIRIDDALSAPRIACQAQRNLNLVGYKAHVQEIKPAMKTKSWSELCEVLVQKQRGSLVDFFDWSARCSCPGSGVPRHTCVRHEQMTPLLAQLLTEREDVVEQGWHGGASNNRSEKLFPLIDRNSPMTAADYLPLSLPENGAQLNPAGLQQHSSFVYEDPLPSYQNEHICQPLPYAPYQHDDDEGRLQHASGQGYAFDSMEGNEDDWEPEPLLYE